MNGPTTGPPIIQRIPKHVLRLIRNTNYCWKHGYDIADDNTSASYRRKKTGHKDEATISNNIGVNQRRKELVMWKFFANGTSKNTHNINKVLEYNISNARNFAILDWVTTGNFLHIRNPFENFIKNEGILVIMYDSNKTTATNTVILDPPYLPIKVIKSHALNN